MDIQAYRADLVKKLEAVDLVIASMGGKVSSATSGKRAKRKPASSADDIMKWMGDGEKSSKDITAKFGQLAVGKIKKLCTVRVDGLKKFYTKKK